MTDFANAYLAYLQTPEWAQKRRECLEKDGNQCVFCGSTCVLQAHHVTYERVGHEDVQSDLITVCKDCHSKIHAAIEWIEKKDCQLKGIFRKKLLNNEPFQEALTELDLARSEALAIAYSRFEKLTGCSTKVKTFNTFQKAIKFQKLENFIVDFFKCNSVVLSHAASPISLVRIFRGVKKAGKPNTLHEWRVFERVNRLILAQMWSDDEYQSLSEKLVKSIGTPNHEQAQKEFINIKQRYQDAKNNRIKELLSNEEYKE